jgi:uncharacterized protein (TIGR03435 family)
MRSASFLGASFILLLTANASAQEFEVATVRPVAPNANIGAFVNFVDGIPLNTVRSGEGVSRGDPALNTTSGTLTLRSVTLRQLVQLAYKEIYRPEYLSGAPGWTDGDRFDVIAKAPPNSSVDSIRPMLQKLLAERFRLRVRRVEKVLPVFALVKAKPDVALPRSAGSSNDGCRRTAGPRTARSPIVLQTTCTNTSMAELASMLTSMGQVISFLDHPVFDSTGLAGKYDFVLSWTPLPLDPNRPAESTLFDALRDLGLKLEERKQSMTTIVIDGVDRIPTGN